MREVTDLLEEIVSAIDCNITITSQQYLGMNVYRLYTCNTKWARTGKTIFAFNDTGYFGYYIKNVVEDEYIEIQYGNADHPFYTCYLPNPFFISGTKLSTNNEWSRVSKNLLDKTPLIWLYQNYSERTFGSENSMERSISATIAFLDETNSKFEKNKDHINNAVKPCNKLKEEFIKSFDNFPIYKKLKQYDSKTFSRFGVETDSGVIQNILDANLSGVVLNITIEKFKEPCKC